MLILVLLATGAYFAYKLLSPLAVAGTKTITVTIDHTNGEDKTLTIKTDSEYLRGALEKEKLIKGENGDYGFFITSVDGEAADESKQQWWGYTKSGEYVDTSVDLTPITNGDSFEFTLHEGY